MKRYTSSQVRQHLADVLDAAERGEPVLIERRGVRFAIRAEPVRRTPHGTRKPILEGMDPAVAEGRWTWTWRAGGLRFARRGRRR